MNKPVAYVTGVRQFDPVSVDTVLKVGTPLYTHPVKELTDEEIIAVYVENYGDDILPNIQASGIEFARAILRKAQKK